MNKEELLQHVAWAAGITEEQAGKAVTALSEGIKKSLSDENGQPKVGEKVKVHGIGTYEVKKTAAGTVNNPQVLTAKKALADGNATDEQKALLERVKTGEVWETKEKPEGKKLAFRPEKALKDWVNPDEDESDDPTGA